MRNEGSAEFGMARGVFSRGACPARGGGRDWGIREAKWPLTPDPSPAGGEGGREFKLRAGAMMFFLKSQGF
jgi:hypothetical protein